MKKAKRVLKKRRKEAWRAYNEAITEKDDF